ncbi:MAG: radical SAM protein [Dictyoglomus thermophilum]|uniref:Radical SAM protein n=1 Tax=Dictyoglomus thermophilum TaxID=14 RepID=A0A7C2CZI0_DICTH|nr:radical SAM protein [Dictyoglomus thermophilum]MCX7720432.1 radical SAM protein [Dictyoglomus thermophilum]TYT24429.1 radical SAM protein [Dictyoglomus thermophilum]
MFITNIIWILDTKCNLSCPHCYVHKRNWEVKISKERALRLIEEAKELSIKGIDFTGGEPLLVKEVFEYIEKARSLGLEVSLNSNALLLNKEIARFLKDNEVYLYVSIDGSNKDVFEKMRGKDNFDRLLNSIELINKFEIPFSVIFSISSLNYFDASNMVRFAKNIGARELCMIPVIPSGEAKNTRIYIGSDLLIRTIREVSEEAEREKYPVVLWCVPFMKSMNFNYVVIDECHVLDYIDLAPTGDIMLCDVIDMPLSEIRTKSLLEALKEVEQNKLYNLLKERDKLCLGCNVATFCKGGCYARAYILENDISKPDPYCPKVLSPSR